MERSAGLLGGLGDVLQAFIVWHLRKQKHKVEKIDQSQNPQCHIWPTGIWRRGRIPLQNCFMGQRVHTLDRAADHADKHHLVEQLVATIMIGEAAAHSIFIVHWGIDVSPVGVGAIIALTPFALESRV